MLSRRLLWCVTFLAMMSFGWHAQAQDLDLPDLQLQRFRPAPGPGDYLGVFGTSIGDHLEWDLHFYLDYADDPLSINTGGLGTSGAGKQTVDGQLTISVLASIALFNRFEVGLLVPFTPFQNSDELQPILSGTNPPSTDDLKSPGFNDWRLTGKWRILDMAEDKLGLAMVMGLSFPLATQETLTSDSGIGFDVIAAAEKYLYKGLRGGINLGFRYRPDRRIVRENTIGNEITFGLGLGVPMFFNKLDGIVEFDSAFGVATRQVGSLEPQEGEFHNELRGVLRYRFNENWTITGGGGFGLNNGVGTPDYRAILGINGRWVTGGSWGYDYDGDGIYGKRDKCPDASEDFDGHEDFDGCPDLDNDGDGVPDERDQCNNTPKGVEVKENGCPDNDLDGDGIPNKLDKCPEDAEDKDGFEDRDGCPDPDNDKDGITDKLDKCPNQPETKNDFQDEDGCPDDPNEKVVIAKDKLIITEPVYFATNRDRILKRSFPILKEVAKVLKENPQIKLVRIEGHTDNRGKKSYNLKLSQRRAASVRKYLIGKGIEPKRLEAVGYGMARPIADNEDEEGRAKNRRVEFTIVEQDKK